MDAGSDVDMHKEYSRQRHHMEKTVASLRKKLQKDTDIHRMEKIRVMQVHNRVYMYDVELYCTERLSRFTL